MLQSNYITCSNTSLLLTLNKFCAMFIYNNKQKIQCPDNVNALGAFFFFSVLSQDFWNLKNQNLNKILVPMIHNNPYILSDQVSGIKKKTWKKREI